MDLIHPMNRLTSKIVTQRIELIKSQIILWKSVLPYNEIILATDSCSEDDFSL